MSHDERPNSLADQAAAWIPPWERRPAPPDADATPEAAAPAAPEAATPASEAAPAAPDAATPASEAAPAAPDAATPASEAAPAAPDHASAPEHATSTSVAADPDRPGKRPSGGPAAAATSRRGAGRRAPAPPPVAEPMGEAELRGALEAILLVVDEPVSELVLAQVLDEPAERVGAMLDRIAAGYTEAGYGFELRRAAGGWRLYTRAEYAAHVERFILDGQSARLTQAALETLAVVAYKQPVTRSRISAIRGVNCDGVIRTLVSRGLVAECGTEPDSGAFLYRTTTMFLEKLGLNSIDDLPPLAPFLPDDVEELADATR